MTSARIQRSARVFQVLCITWILGLIAVAIVRRPPASTPLQARSFWELSAGALALVWVALALWADGFRFKPRGGSAHVITRGAAPSKYWLNVVLAAIMSFGLLFIGWRGLTPR